MILCITGATAGFGAAFSRHFLKSGHRVIAVGRRGDRLETLQREFPDRVLSLPLDLRERGMVLKSFADLPAEWKDIDVLINNAGLALGLASAQNALVSDWDAMVDTNIKGLLYCCHAVLPTMVRRNRGHIINLGSVAGSIPYPGGNVYGATKAFVHQLSLNLRADLLGTAVRVTCIEPGLCSDTEFSDVRFKGDRQKAASVYEGVKALTSQDLVETVDWILHRPAHVNINVISLMPVQQAFGPYGIDRSRLF